MATYQPSSTAPRTWSSGTLDVLEEDLGEPGLPVELGDGPDGHARGVHGDEEVGEAPVALGVGVGAEQAEDPVGEGAAAEHHVFCPFRTQAPRRHRRRQLGPAADGGQVAAGVGLGPALAPDLLARRHRREDTGPAAPGCRTRTGWGRGGRSRSGRPGWGRRPGSTPPRRSATPKSPTPRPAELLGPRDDRPAGVVHRPAPRPGGPRSPRRCRATAAGPVPWTPRGRGPRARTGPRRGSRSCSAVNRRSMAPANLTHRQILRQQWGPSCRREGPCPTP